ncbi:MAG: hypothetical protein ACI81L_000054 [Verrucomicrobiales bacterium]|jgi:hypothetical protein
MTGTYDDLIERLESIGEELADRGIERLRSSIDGQVENYGDEERRIGKARRAVEKAVHELRGPVEHY